MTIEEIIEMLRNRITANAQYRQKAVDRGDFEAVEYLDADTSKTREALSAIETSEDYTIQF